MHKPEFLSEAILSKVRAGAWGWLAGSTLGAPSDTKPDWRNLTYHTPIPDGMIETFPSTCAALYLRSGKNQFGLGDLWRKELKAGPDAYRFAAANLARGLRAPLSGQFQNPFAQDGSAIGRAAFWGLLFAGRPGTAAAWAWHDASVDHTGDAVWAGAHWAAAVAAAPFLSSLSECLSLAEQAVPDGSRLRKLLPAVLQAKQIGRTWQEARDVCLSWDGGISPESAIAAHAFALVGCVYGDGDFARTVCVAAGCGGCSISSASVAGAIVAAGAGNLPDDWKQPLGDEFRASVKSPKLIVGFLEALEERFLILAKAAPFSLVETLTQQAPGPEGQVPATNPEPDLSFLSDLSAIAHLRPARFGEGQKRMGDLIGSFSYPDGIAHPASRPVSIGFRLENPESAPVEVEPKISATEGLTATYRAGRQRIESGASITLGTIAKSDGVSRGFVTLAVGDDELAAPYLAPQIWWVVGPFANRENEGYEKAYMPERGDKPSDVFSDRSGAAITWVETYFEGVYFDLEPQFTNAPGVVYLSTEAYFDLPGKMTLVVAAPVGQVVWINGEKRGWYQDTHVPIPRPVAPYAIEFECHGWTKFLIKVTRDAPPLIPVVIYYLDATGAAVFPAKFRQPGAE